MNKIRLLLLAAVAILSVQCAADKNSEGKIRIITTLFPQYDFARTIGGEKADISILLPPGIEPHSFEPTPRDIIRISKSDLFIYTGEFMEPWAHKIIESLPDSSKVTVIEAGKGIKLISHDDSDGSENDGPEEHNGADPHIWTDPMNALKMSQNILEGMIAADPANEAYYRNNAAALERDLRKLDADFTETFKKTRFKTIIYAGHYAFGYFSSRYGLEHISPYRGFSPNAEPTPGNIAKLIATMRETGISSVYYEELIDPKVAKTISAQTGAEILLLHGAHNVTRKELTHGISYVSIMRDNMERLKKGLCYSE